MAVSVDYLQLGIPGEPRGQGRPRFARAGKGVRTYTDEATRSYAERIGTEWIAAGRPELADGPYALTITALMRRPQGHYRADGTTLSAAGQRSAYPTRKPDLTNVAKLIEDALCAVMALPDDAACVSLQAQKLWTLTLGPQVLVQAMSRRGEAPGVSNSGDVAAVLAANGSTAAMAAVALNRRWSAAVG